MSLRYGKKGEDAWTADLAHELGKLGLTATPFPIYHVYEAGRRTITKPDIEITNGGVSVGSAKLGEDKLLAALSTAQEYAVKVPRAEELRDKPLREVFAITYRSERSEPYHLYVLARPGRPAVKTFISETIGDLAANIATILRGEEDRLREEAITLAAPRLLYYGARELARSITGVSQEELQKVFGGHHFFDAVLATNLKGSERTETLRLGAAFLFVNQIFFYVLLSKAAEEANRSQEYPPIAENDIGSPHRLHDVYFKRVHEKNYEPIYGIRLAPFFKGAEITDACRNVVRAIVALAPKFDRRDLAGQVFQTLIPFSIRKPLGAHYTNPRAAEFLARLAIETGDTTVFDPACGSGTLLVASYQRKMELAEVLNENLHHRFVEHDITGTDAMAFAAHLAAVNLALQQPLMNTDHVRIATTDSTSLAPGKVVEATEDVLPSGLRTATLEDDFTAGRSPRKRGPVGMRGAPVRAFTVDQVDLVIMNPPFTSWYNMQESYRDGLKRRFTEYNKDFGRILAGKPSQQAFFILLADRLIRPGGKLAAVLPLTTLTGRTFQALTQFLLNNYTITHIVVGLGRASFSEDTSFTECLLIAKKTPPRKNSEFVLIGSLKPPTEWTHETIRSMTDADRTDYATTKQFPQTLLSPGSETLWGLALRLHERYDKSRSVLDEILSSSRIRLTSIGRMTEKRDMEIHRPILAGEHLYKVGPKSMFACRTEARAIKDVDKLVLKNFIDDLVVFRDRFSGATYEFPKRDVVPALRRFSLLQQLDITGLTDFGIAEPGPALEKTMTAFYKKKDAEKFLKFLRTKNKLRKIVESGSSRLILVRRIDLAAPGTTLLCCWSKEPVLLAANGFTVNGFSDERREQLFSLWINSSVALSYILSKATVTRGSWVYLDKFLIDLVPIPDFDALSQKDWEGVDNLWNELDQVQLPSLLDQVKGVHSYRVRLDDGILELLGVGDSERRKEIGSVVRAGLLDVIQALKRTMESRETEPDE